MAKRQTIYIQGMHCASCELLIEKYILAQEGVTSVEVSLHDSKANIYYEGNNEIDISKLNKEFEKMRYVFSKKKKTIHQTPVFQIKDGTLTINKERMNTLLNIGLIILLVITVFIVVDKLQLAKYINQLKFSF